MHKLKPELTIRSATERDAPELARLLTELGHPISESQIREMWVEWAEAGNVAFVGSHEEDRLLGVVTIHKMAVLHRPKPVGRITALIVDPTARGTGLGRSLVLRAEIALLASGCGLIEITSNDRLVDAHAFYEHLGYKRTSIRLAKDISQSNFESSPISPSSVT